MRRTTTLRSQRYMSCARTRGHRASDIFCAQHPLMCASFNTESARRYIESCNVLHIRGQFHQHFTSSFCTNRSQKCDKTLMTWLSFCAFGIFVRKSCELTCWWNWPQVRDHTGEGFVWSYIFYANFSMGDDFDRKHFLFSNFR